MTSRTTSAPVSPSVAAVVRVRIDAAPTGTFFRPQDFTGPATAVYMALSRAVSDGQIRRLRKGLYYKGTPTRYGMSGPDRLELGLAIAGPSSGPTGINAAHFLGFTTQVPVVVDLAVPGRPPAPLPGIFFASRPLRRASFDLNPTEVAVLEVLRLWPRAHETTISDMGTTFTRLAHSGAISLPTISRVVASERVRAARTLWARLLPSLPDPNTLP